MTAAAKQSVIVTGASGLVGWRAVAELAKNRDVWAMSRTPPASPLSGVQWIAHDFERSALPAGMPSRIDTIVHLAQSANYRSFPADAPEIHAVAVNATLQLLDWGARTGARRFVFASTGGLYAPSAEPIDETAPLSIADDPLGFYLTTKRIGELLAERYASLMTVVVLRFFFVYGPGQRPSMLFPRLIASVAEGRPLTLQGEDGFFSNPLHVDDAARAVARACDLNQGAVINIAGPETLSLRRIGELIGGEVGRSPLFVQDPAAKPQHRIADTGRMRRLLEPPRIAPATGIPLVARACRNATACVDR